MKGNETTLTLRSPPNYEAPNDANADYTYDVTIHITDDDKSASSFDLELTYNDVDEPAIFDYGDGNTSVTYKDAGSFDEDTLHMTSLLFRLGMTLLPHPVLNRISSTV